jgi:hypothetical protein
MMRRIYLTFPKLTTILMEDLPQSKMSPTQMMMTKISREIPERAGKVQRRNTKRIC